MSTFNTRTCLCENSHNRQNQWRVTKANSGYTYTTAVCAPRHTEW